jgi:hypothetical protein
VAVVLVLVVRLRQQAIFLWVAGVVLVDTQSGVLTFLRLQL